MSANHLQIFHIGRWKVEPALGALTGPNADTVHLEPKVMAVLLLLAEHPGQLVSRTELLDGVWPQHPAADELLTKAVSDLRRALHDDRGNPEFIETIPKRGYRLIVQVRIPEASGHDVEPASPPALDLFSRNRLVAGFVAVLTVTAMLIAWEKIRSPPIDIHSVAVLPFANLTADPAQTWLSDGISVEILSDLGEIPGLKIPGRKSSFRFRGDDLDPREVGALLGVDTLLEGSVQRDGDSLRISAQLVSVTDGFVIWSDSYDRTIEDLLSTQDDIAGAVVDALQPHLNFEPVMTRTDQIAATSAAYAEYLQGLHFLDQVFAPGQSDTNLSAPRQALEHMRQATELAPEFALAWAGRARALDWLTSLTGQSWEEAEPLIEAWLEKALELGGDFAEVQFTVGSWKEGDEAIAHLERAIEINPNYAEAYAILTQKLMNRGRFRDYFAAAATAVVLDPLDKWSDWYAMYADFHQGTLANLDDRLRRNRQFWPTSNALADEVHLRVELGQLQYLPNLHERADALGPGFGVDPPQWISGPPRHFGDGYLTLGLVEPARRFLEWRYTDVINLYNGDPASAIEFLVGELQESRNTTTGYYRTFADVLSSLVQTYLYAGQYENLVETMDDLDVSSRLPRLPYPEYTNPPWPQVAYAYAQFKLGNESVGLQRLDLLATQLDDRIAQGVNLPNHYYELARVRVMQGDNDEAFDALRKAIEMGWRRWYLELDPILEPVRLMPEFVALKAQYDADLANKRRIVQQHLADLRKDSIR